MLSRRTLLLSPAATILRSQDRQPRMFGNAEAYERFMGRWSRLVAAPLLDFTGLPETGQVLDVGSGTGSLAFAIAERNVRTTVLGIDPSQEYVAYAASRNRFGTRAAFEVGDAQQLRFPDASFAGAISLLVFNFIPDPKKALGELRRVTTQEGKISAAVWDYGVGMRMLRTFWDAAVHMDPQSVKLDEKNMPLCRAGELAALWKQGGLENIQERSIDIRMRFESIADYWDPFLLGQGPAGAYVRRLAHDKAEALRKDVQRRLSLPAENASFELPARVWSVRGTVPKPQ